MLSKFSLFHTALHQWYGAAGRHDLPWRNIKDPYPIYLSEVMLQQTQVQTVLERYYFPFLQQFPTLTALAEAPREQVLKAWQGLGYYNRARYLHETAQLTAPSLPDNFAGLIKLPGIGKNTAHAILAFGFHQPVAILEANVKRVIHRIFALEAASPATLWQHAETLLNPASPFHYNQAMMDLGSLICTPKAPQCDECPAARICLGKTSPLSYPAPRQIKATPVRRRIILVLCDASGRYYLTQRQSRFLHGLYGFIELDAAATHFSYYGQDLPLNDAVHLGDIIQTYSHFRLEAAVLRLPINIRPNEPCWYPPDELAHLPLSRADEKVIELLKPPFLAASHAMLSTQSALK